MRLVQTRHGLVRLAAIVVGGVALTAWAMYEERHAREQINRASEAGELEQVKEALDRYLGAHQGTYPPRLEVLVESGLLPDGAVLTGLTFPAAGKRYAELNPADYVVVQRERPWVEHKENTPPNFALRVDGQVEYAAR